MKRKQYTIDFTNVEQFLEMHNVISKALDFPDYYGCSWSSFWDCLTDMYGDFIHIEIIGLEIIREKFDDSADKLVDILKRFKHYANDRFSDGIKIEIVSGSTREEIE